MTVSKFLIIYFTSLVAFLIIDFIWLGIISRNFIQSQLGELLTEKLKLLPALITYLLIVLGVVYFAVLPGLKEGNIAKTIISAILFGLICYATYDLTNYSTIKDWPLKLTLVDIIWGGTISSLVSVVGFYAGSLLK